MAFIEVVFFRGGRVSPYTCSFYTGALLSIFWGSYKRSYILANSSHFTNHPFEGIFRSFGILTKTIWFRSILRMCAKTKNMDKEKCLLIFAPLLGYLFFIYVGNSEVFVWGGGVVFHFVLLLVFCSYHQCSWFLFTSFCFLMANKMFSFSYVVEHQTMW